MIRLGFFLNESIVMSFLSSCHLLTDCNLHLSPAKFCGCGSKDIDTQTPFFTFSAAMTNHQNISKRIMFITSVSGTPGIWIYPQCGCREGEGLSNPNGFSIVNSQGFCMVHPFTTSHEHSQRTNEIPGGLPCRAAEPKQAAAL